MSGIIAQAPRADAHAATAPSAVEVGSTVEVAVPVEVKPEAAAKTARKPAAKSPTASAKKIAPTAAKKRAPRSVKKADLIPASKAASKGVAQVAPKAETPSNTKNGVASKVVKAVKTSKTSKTGKTSKSAQVTSKALQKPLPKVQGAGTVKTVESKTTKSSVGSPAKAKTKLPAAPAKVKMVRDSFTMPRDEFDLIDQIKARALNFRRPTKKSEILRAGLSALMALSDRQLQAALAGLKPIKAGRPKKND